MRSSPSSRRLAVAVVLVVSTAMIPAAARAVEATPARSAADADPAHDSVHPSWRWPTDGVRIVEPYDAPPHAFAAGHRGIDLLAGPGAPVRAPADGVVVFAGVVVDRGVVTIDHGDGRVSSLEPVEAAPPPGTRVRAGQVVGRASTGGHAAKGSVHLGVRHHGQYVDPLTLLGRPPRAVLLPCC